MIIRTSIVLTLALVIAAQSAAAQNPRSRTPSTPNPAHERLAVFEGSWAADATGAGRVARDSCAWLAGGRRHMICQRRSDTSSTAAEQMMIYSYRGADSTYTVTVLLPGGQLWRYAGRPEGNRWEFYLEPNRAGATQRLRQVVVASADTLHFIEEASENGGPWRLTDPSEDYRYVRVRGARDR